MGFLGRISKGESTSPEEKHAVQDPEHADPSLAKYESQGQGEVRNAFEDGGKNYRTLGKWQAALVMITNQIGLGILSLPSASQKIGIVLVSWESL